MTTDTERIAHLFLLYSFKDIDYSYDGLTDEEQTFCTRGEFNQMIRELREGEQEEASWEQK